MKYTSEQVRKWVGELVCRWQSHEDVFLDPGVTRCPSCGAMREGATFSLMPGARLEGVWVDDQDGLVAIIENGQFRFSPTVYVRVRARERTEHLGTPTGKVPDSATTISKEMIQVLDDIALVVTRGIERALQRAVEQGDASRGKGPR